MISNVLLIPGELLGIIGGAAALFFFAVGIALRHRPRTLPGSSGHRDELGQEHEVIRADGYIDSFAGDIEEAGGGVPPAVIVALPGILLWWVVYLVHNWAPK